VTREARFMAWIAVLVVVGVIIYLLRGILAPFLAGLAVAYLLDPLVDRLEAKRLSRTVATLLVLALFLGLLVGALVLLAPLIYTQLAALVGRIPDYVDAVRTAVAPVLEQLQAKLMDDQVQRLRSAAGEYAGDVVAWLGRVLGGLWSGGLALFNLISLAVIMPLVAFYMLRDWDRIVAWIDGLVPRDAVATVREQAAEIDLRLAGFVRGQATVCLLLGTLYGIGLTVVGLEFGLVVGLGAGLVSFVPYLGTAVGLIAGLGLAFAQFSDWLPILLVALVFGVGQVLEGFVLTPNLVGDRVGLHPAWVLFALMAGGALFGFTGVLLALPAAAVIGVLVRFVVQRYRDGPLYNGDPG